MMLESQNRGIMLENQSGNLPDDLRIGREQRLEHYILQFLVTSYRNMYEKVRYDALWKENTFSAVLTNYLRKSRTDLCRQTHQNWHVEREGYNDDELICSGQADPDTSTRIDIVIYTWDLDNEEIRFPFECKLLDEDNSTLIRRYIENGLIDRYLTEKDYSKGSSWGGMMGYIRRGKHNAIVVKLNKQIERQLNSANDYLNIYQPVDRFEAIYKSHHQRPNRTTSLIVTHLFLTFRSQAEESAEHEIDQIHSKL
jgi:hypothetical protein